MVKTNYGAEPGDWLYLDLVLGLGEDLLPVVSNPRAVISPQSKMKALGKTPSRYNGKREAGGISNWTSHKATQKDLAKWAAEPDYGICIQTNTVRALDCDIDDEQLAKEIHDEINKALHPLLLPVRRRDGASKFLLAFRLPGEYAKRTIKTAHGIIEFLGTGQQFVAVGTHPSGARYDWVGGLPSEIPELQPDVFEKLWSRLVECFAVDGGENRALAPAKQTKLIEAAQNDPVAKSLVDKGLVISTERDGRLHVECPFGSEHTSDSAESATTYFPAFTGGFERGHFRCLHAHCEQRTDTEFLLALGLLEDPRDDFSAAIISATSAASAENPPRFTFVGDSVFSAGKPMGWIVKGVIPKGELGVVYGPPGSGKSFWALDLCMAIAQGQTWCGRKVHRARVGYVAAEGAGGFRNRLQAYRRFYALPPQDFLHVMAGTPNLLQKADVVDLGKAMLRAGGVDFLVYDTLARGTVGGDENSAQDMGLAIANCRVLHDVTGAMIMLVHHSGKDPSKGARGSNAILGAVDVEIEIARVDANRTATVSKLKDGEDGMQFGFILKTVPIGMDEDNDVISSCVVEHGEVVRAQPKEKRLGPLGEIAWRIIKDLQGVEGPPSYATVRDAVIEALPEPTGDRDQRRAHAEGAITRLQARGSIKVVGGFVTIQDGE